MRKRPTGQLHLFHQVATVAAPTATVQNSLFDLVPDFAPPLVVKPWQREARITMREIRDNLQAALNVDVDAVGLRWRDALDRRYPGMHRDKRIAKDFGVDPRTAQSWRASEPQHPSVKHLCKAALIHGPSIIVEVLLPGTDLEREVRLDDGLRQLEARLESLRRSLAEIVEFRR